MKPLSLASAITVFAFLVSPFLAGGEATEKIDLPRAIQIALENNQEIAEARGSVTVGQGMLMEARTGYWPKFKMDVGYSYGQAPKMAISDDLIQVFARSAGLTSASEMINDVEGLAILAVMLGPDGLLGTGDDMTADQARQKLESTDPAVNPLRHRGESGTPLTISDDGLSGHIAEHHANPITWKGDEYYFDFNGIKTYPLAAYSWDKIYSTSYDIAEDFATLNSLGEQYFSTRISLLQPIYTFGKISGYQQAAKMQLKISEQEVNKKINEVIYAVSERYYQILLAREGIRIAEKTVGQLKATRDITKSLLQRGSTRVTTIDLLKNNIYLHLAKEKLIEARNGAQLAICALNFRMGRSPEAEIHLAEDALQYTVRDLQWEHLSKEIYHGRPEWQQIQLGVKALEAMIRIARSDYFPMLGLSGEMQYLADKPDYYLQGNPQPTYRITIGLAYEHFDFFQTTGAKVKQAEGELEKLKAKQQWVRQGLIMELKKAYLTAQEKLAKIQESARAADDAVEHYRLCFEGYRIGIKEVADVLEAQIMEAEIQYNHKESIFGYLLALAELKKTVGEKPPARQRRQ